jgi:hypothetical protein
VSEIVDLTDEELAAFMKDVAAAAGTSFAPQISQNSCQVALPEYTDL